MKTSKRFVVLAAAVFATLVGSSALSKSPFQIDEFDYVDTVYVSCLDEYVELNWHITVKYREFVTKSGAWHYIEYWDHDLVAIGQDSDRIWIGGGPSPGTFHARKADVGQFTSSGFAKSVNGDGPKLRYNDRLKYTYNANGDLKVEWLPPEDFGEWLRCLGPKS